MSRFITSLFAVLLLGCSGSISEPSPSPSSDDGGPCVEGHVQCAFPTMFTPYRAGGTTIEICKGGVYVTDSTCAGRTECIEPGNNTAQCICVGLDAGGNCEPGPDQ